MTDALAIEFIKNFEVMTFAELMDFIDSLEDKDATFFKDILRESFK